MLLHGLGVRDEVFISRFKTYLEELERMTTSAEVAVKYLIQKNDMKLAQSVIVDPKNLQNSQTQHRLKTILGEEMEKLDKLRPIIHKSRNAFGVCDPSGILQYGQVTC